MLDKKNKRDVVLVTAGAIEGPLYIRLETKYIEVIVSSVKSVSGKPELWTKIMTKPAFEVALLKRVENELRVILMRKRRKAADQLLTKLPGGYLWGPKETFMAGKIRQDTGIQFSYESLNPLGHVIGHSEINTLIELYWTTEWETVAQPPVGVDIINVTLKEAVEMAINYNVENDSSFTALMRLYYLMKEGKLNL